MKASNPFSLTKAVDLTDDQINELWVDLGSGGFAKKAKPTSPMPMVILGGKGSGKTHLMRHYAYQVQKLRAQSKDLFGFIVDEGYLGIYIRTPGLNAHRFKDKSQSLESWHVLFSYYLELWFSQTLIAVFIDFLRVSGRQLNDEANITTKLLALFDEPVPEKPKSLEAFAALLHELQKKLDYQINNAAFSRTLEVKVLAVNGRLIFGVPRILQSCFKEFRELVFLYLVDEYEHFDERAQRYFNTLIREREFPVGFKVGVKLYGLKTTRTYSGDEGLKEGSEYERLMLDEDLRAHPKIYRQFALNLVKSRLQQVHPAGGQLSEKDVLSWFPDADSLPPQQTDWGRAGARFAATERPAVATLRQRLLDSARANPRLGLTTERDIEAVVDAMSFPDDFLLEKTNCFLLYRAWYRNKPLLQTAKDIRRSCEAFFRGKKAGTEHQKVLDKFELDLRHQFIVEAEHRIDYLGLESFVLMSHGIARNLLTILRGIYEWGQFYGDGSSRPASLQAQQASVEEASNWFFNEAQIESEEGKRVADAIDRLGELLQAIRYSDKPSECSLRSFSLEWDGLDAETRRMITLAEQLSYIVRDDERKDRNTGRPQPKFQLNRMLSPRYRLPLASRGSIQLTAFEARAVFGDVSLDGFRRAKAERLKELNAPFSGGRADKNYELELD